MCTVNRCSALVTTKISVVISVTCTRKLSSALVASDVIISVMVHGAGKLGITVITEIIGVFINVLATIDTLVTLVTR